MPDAEDQKSEMARGAPPPWQSSQSKAPANGAPPNAEISPSRCSPRMTLVAQSSLSSNARTIDRLGAGAPQPDRHRALVPGALARRAVSRNPPAHEPTVLTPCPCCNSGSEIRRAQRARPQTSLCRDLPEGD